MHNFSISENLRLVRQLKIRFWNLNIKMKNKPLDNVDKKALSIGLK